MHVGAPDGAAYPSRVMSPVTPPTRPEQKRSRTPAIVALSIAVFLLFGVIFSQATFNLTFLQPDTSEETLIFAALSALIFLLFVALTFVLLRTLLRLYAERKTGVMGSKLRSRMVMGALLLVPGTGHLPFHVFLRPDQPLNREVVLATGGRRAISHRRGGFAADRLCRRQCAGRSRTDRVDAGGQEIVRNRQFQLCAGRVPSQ